MSRPVSLPRIQAAERRRSFVELLSRSSFGCPRRPISCGHMLSDHAGQGYDDAGVPVDPSCTVLGCDCNGVS